MTLETANVVLSATTVALLLIGGFYLRNIKDETIKALQATIQAKDAEISRLKGDTAPAIARAYAEMRQHANQMTEEVTSMNEKLREAALHQQNSQASAEAKRFVGRQQGILYAVELVLGPYRRLTDDNWDTPEMELKSYQLFSASVGNALQTMLQEARTSNQKAANLLKQSEQQSTSA